MKRINLKMLLITSIVMFFTSLTDQIYSQCDLNDWQALQDLYVSASGTSWSNSAGWDQVDPLLNPTGPPLGCDLSTMFGVQVDNTTGRVKSLFLVSNQLSGTIPASIGDLTGLTTLSLSVNQLTGSIPSSIGNLTDLTSLFLFDNQLTGNIPAELWTLINLSQLSLRDNKLTGTIPADIGDLMDLTSIDLSRNMLIGDIPMELWTLTNLTQISLVSNQFTGGIPTDISNLVNLNNLYLSDNLLSGPLPSEIGFLNLSNLTLDGNQFTGPIPPSFGNLTNLNQLDLSDNLLTGCYDPALTTLCNWSNIRISDGNNFDAAWQDYCMNGDGACAPSCAPIAHVEVQSADVYLDDACYGVILTSPNGSCYRLKVQDDGTFTSELVTCP